MLNVHISSKIKALVRARTYRSCSYIYPGHCAYSFHSKLLWITSRVPITLLLNRRDSILLLMDLESSGVFHPFFLNFHLLQCYWMQVCVPDAQRGQTNWHIRVWSRERFIAGPCKENGWLVPQKSRTPEGIQQSVFKGQVWEGDCRVCDQLMHHSLIGWR